MLCERVRQPFFEILNFYIPRFPAEANGGEQLFHAVILQSGTALDKWAHDPDTEKGFTAQADAVNCLKMNDKNETDVDKSFKCMKYDRTAEELAIAFSKLSVRLPGFNGAFGTLFTV